MTRDQIARLHNAVSEIESRQQEIALSQRTKAERDAFYAEAAAEGHWPDMEGLDFRWQAAVLAAKRANS